MGCIEARECPQPISRIPIHFVPFSQTAMLPNAEALVNFSRYLIKSRPHAESIAFPGCPHKSDLDILVTTAPDLRDDLHSMTLGNNFLSANDITELRDLRDDLHRVCRHAKERGVRIIVDAEYRCVSVDFCSFLITRSHFDEIMLSGITTQLVPGSHGDNSYTQNGEIIVFFH